MHPYVSFNIPKGQDSLSVIVDIVRAFIAQNCTILRRYMDMKIGERRVFMAPKSVKFADKHFRSTETEAFFCGIFLYESS